MKHKIAMVLICVLLTAGIILTGLRIRTVRVTGAKNYTEEEIEEILFPTPLYRNTLVCFVRQSLGKKKDIPFVQDYKILFLSPSEVEVIVYEKSIVGYLSYMSSLMYFDKDGIVVESARQKLPGIPEITGLHFGQIVLYKPLPVESSRIFSLILNLTQTLQSYQIPVERIRYDKDLNATLIIGDMDVLLGDAAEMNGKIAELSNMLPHIQGESGELDLRDYEPTDPGRGHSFRRKPPRSEGR